MQYAGNIPKRYVTADLYLTFVRILEENRSMVFEALENAVH